MDILSDDIQLCFHLIFNDAHDGWNAGKIGGRNYHSPITAEGRGDARHIVHVRGKTRLGGTTFRDRHARAGRPARSDINSASG
jgi:hypothetical protein